MAGEGRGREATARQRQRDQTGAHRQTGGLREGQCSVRGRDGQTSPCKPLKRTMFWTRQKPLNLTLCISQNNSVLFIRGRADQSNPALRTVESQNEYEARASEHLKGTIFLYQKRLSSSAPGSKHWFTTSFEDAGKRCSDTGSAYTHLKGAVFCTRTSLSNFALWAF